jgi:hypothetical protein
LVVVLVAVFAIWRFPLNATDLSDDSICIGFQLWISNPQATVSTAFMGEYGHRMICCYGLATIDLGARPTRGTVKLMPSGQSWRRLSRQ